MINKTDIYGDNKILAHELTRFHMLALYDFMCPLTDFLDLEDLKARYGKAEEQRKSKILGKD